MGQVEQPGTRPVQAGEGRHPGHRAAQQVLLRRIRGQRVGQDVLQGCQQEAERAALGAVRESSGGVQGHGHQQGLPNARRGHVHVRAAHTTTSAGCWRPESTRSPLSSTPPTEQTATHIYPTMGRGRSGGTTSSRRKAIRNNRRYGIEILHQPNLVGGGFIRIPVATQYQRAQPTAPHEQTPAWARHTGSTPRAHPAW